MEHIYFVLFNFTILAFILYFDRKNIKNYVIIGIVGLITSFAFENLTTYLGFWYYHSKPLALYFSFYTWILYVPYLSYTYFVVNRLVVKK